MRDRRPLLRRPPPSRRRGLAIAAALALAITACTSSAEKANRYDMLADQLVSVGAYPAAVGALQRALRYDANNADRWIRMGRVQRQLGQIALAATSYQRALDLAPDNVEALQSLVVLLVRGGQYDLAKTYAATLAVLAPDDLGGLLAQGAIALHERRLIDADKLAERVMTLAPSLSEGFILKARVLEERGQVAAAADLLTRRLAFDRGNPDLAAQVLRLKRKVGDREGVRDAALVLAELLPNDPRYQLEAARALRARGQPARADQLLARTGQRWRDNAQVQLGVAHAWLETMPHPAAIARIGTMAAAAPGEAKAALATLLVQQDEPARALALLQPALGDKVDGGTVDVRAAYAGALFAAHRNAEAAARAGEVLAFDERIPAALLVRARVAAARGDYRRALDDAQLVMAEEPQDRDAALLVARFWAAQGNTVLADKAFGTAQDRFPDDLGIHEARIRWLLAQGRAGDAVALAVSFLNQHGPTRTSLALVADACTAAGNRFCAADARRQLARG